MAELSPGSPESEDIEKIEIEVIEEIEEGEINEDIAIIREELVEVMEVKKEVNEEIEVYENFKEFQEKYKDEFSQNFQGDHIFVHRLGSSTYMYVIVNIDGGYIGRAKSSFMNMYYIHKRGGRETHRIILNF